MSENAATRTRLVAKLAMTIVVAGALMAGLLLPWIGGAGLVARNSASLLDALPVELTDQTPAGNTRVLAADGQLITNFYTNNRTAVTADKISEVMKQALVDIEDSRFYDHNGLDVQGTARALMRNLAARSVQEGGSTLTQQLVKQTLLQSAITEEERLAATADDVARKLREARLALALEEKYSKDEILTRYLNIVYFGQGAYGIQAAAQRYFSVNAADLDLAQASMLAGLVQSPANDDPINNPESAQVRRNQVLQRMHTLNHISDAQLAEISAQPVAVKPGLPPANGCIDASIGGFFCAYVYEYLRGTLKLSQDQIDNGGLTIQTTLRPDMQAAGDQAVLNSMPMGDKIAAMYTAVQPGTGRVLAMSVNRKYGCSAPECESVVLNTAASQGSGSTYKVFTAAAALEEGFSKYYTITTGSSYTSRVYKNGSAPYRVSGGSNTPATADMEKALIVSSNPYFLALEDALGSVEKPVTMALRMGMRFDRVPAEQIIEENNGSFTFGPYPTSPLHLAGAYSTLAANGTQCDPTPVTAVLDRTGEPLKNADGEPVFTGDSCTPESIPPGVATTLNQILRKDVEPGVAGATGRRAYVPGHQIAGKTGTTQDRFSIAFVGYTPEYTASVMVLNPKRNEDVGSFGGGLGATIWHDAMAPILGGRERQHPARAELLVGVQLRERAGGGRLRHRPAPRRQRRAGGHLPRHQSRGGTARAGRPDHRHPGEQRRRLRRTGPGPGTRPRPRAARTARNQRRRRWRWRWRWRQTGRRQRHRWRRRRRLAISPAVGVPPRPPESRRPGRRRRP
jgi:membrane peptidoglycan carboxypeptidase